MKPCKYCSESAKFDRNTRKMLCVKHRSIENNMRTLWVAIADLQYRSENKIQG